MNTTFELSSILSWGRRVGDSDGKWKIAEIYNNNPTESYLHTYIVLECELATVTLSRAKATDDWMVDTIVWNR